MLAHHELSIGIAIHVLLQDVILHDGLQVLKLVARMPTRILQQRNGFPAMGRVGLSRSLLLCEDGNDRLPTTSLMKCGQVPNLDLGLGCIRPGLAIEEPIASSLLTNELQGSTDELA
jgi:hypothetical protein